MLKKMMTPMLATLCTIGLLACGQDGQPDPVGNSQTVKLNRLASGDLQYCDTNGQCQTLPYGGECVALEIDIDLTSGETCQRCILEDGTAVDQGCGQSAVACVLITLPEPDCVVCAYVNGAIIFSSCVATEPTCQSDADCASSISSRSPAVCIDGQCVAQPGCGFDGDCPSGFVCELRACPMYDCAPDSDCPPPPECSGVCVPAPTECQDATDCPAGMTCQFYCMGACPPNGPCDSDPCKGVCEPVREECYSDSDCPEGFICDFYYGTDNSSSGSSDAPSAVVQGGVCIPRQNGCGSDTDCPRGMACQMNCMPCAPSSDACNDGCQGVCVQVETYCWSDTDCPAGQVCEMVYTAGGSSSSGQSDLVAPQGVCVPAPQRCASDFDCSWDGFGLGICWGGECIYSVECDTQLAACDMLPPACEGGKVPSIIGACFGPCVDPAMCAVPTPCVVSGCNGEICGPTPMYSTCEARPGYGCFWNATCEPQADGQCGWTQTEDLTLCLANGQP
jgi:Cys-rich repeat protein